MSAPTNLSELLRMAAASIASGVVDESVINELIRDKESIAKAVSQMDEATRLRFAAISILLDQAASRIADLENSGIPLSKTWGRQDIEVSAEEKPLSKTWGRQDIEVTSGEKPLSKTWGRQDIEVTSGEKPLSKTWGRQDIEVTSGEKPLSKTWGRQDIEVTSGEKPLSKTWGRQDIEIPKDPDPQS